MAILGASGGGTKSNLPELLCVTSRSFQPPYACKIIVHCFGGGGGGAAAYYNMETNQTIRASGGGAGEHSCSLLTVDPAVTYTVTVGATGSNPYSRDNTRTANGGAGGTTSFAGSDIVTVTANGGGGGNAARASSGIIQTAGGTGGTGGAGNLFNLAGGAGGMCENNNSASANAQELASGGGAVNIYGNAFSGGISHANGTFNGAIAISGGAGIGGSAGRAYSYNGLDVSTRGGNLFGPSGQASSAAMGPVPPSIKVASSVEGFGEPINGTSQTPDIGNNTKGSIFDLLNHMVPYNSHGIQPPGVGGRGVGIGDGTSGSGGEQNVNCPASNASLFAGGGGMRSYSDGVNVSNGGNGWGGVGGGGGGGQVYRGQSTTGLAGYAGRGGKGLVVIQFIEVVS